MSNFKFYHGQSVKSSEMSYEGTIMGSLVQEGKNLYSVYFPDRLEGSKIVQVWEDKLTLV